LPRKWKEEAPDEASEPHQILRIFWARFRLLMRFLRHFQRILPRFFQTREERFNVVGIPASI
jgi:hypothetical protein